MHQTDVARIASVSFSINNIKSFNDFTARAARHVSFACDYSANLIVFPEYITAPLLGLKPSWDHWTKTYQEYFQDLAIQKKIDILAGTHLITRPDGSITNTAFYFTKDGKTHEQDKWHLTPFETQNIPQGKRGNDFTLIQTTFGTLAIAICYDVEFPEFVRLLAQAGADVVLVPSCTDDMQGFWRVRYCCNARCIENQIGVVQAPLVGALDTFAGFEQNVGKAGILSPCDAGFASAGIVAEGALDADYCVIGDLHIKTLRANRSSGSVTPAKDLRLADYRQDKRR